MVPGSRSSAARDRVHDRSRRAHRRTLASRRTSGPSRRTSTGSSARRELVGARRAARRGGRPSGRQVLDVGCGTGALASALAEQGARWGLDPSEEMLAVARAAVGKRVELKLGRAEDVPFKDAWFERVLRLSPPPPDRRALPELARVLVPRGRASIATFTEGHFEWYWLASVFPEWGRSTAGAFRGPTRSRPELLEAGFATTRTTILGQRRSISRPTRRAHPGPVHLDAPPARRGDLRRRPGTRRARASEDRVAHQWAVCHERRAPARAARHPSARAASLPPAL